MHTLLPFAFILIPSLLMLLRADEDNDDVIESFSLYYIFSVFPSFVYYYDNTKYLSMTRSLAFSIT